MLSDSVCCRQGKATTDNGSHGSSTAAQVAGRGRRAEAAVCLRGSLVIKRLVRLDYLRARQRELFEIRMFCQLLYSVFVDSSRPKPGLKYYNILTERSLLPAAGGAQSSSAVVSDASLYSTHSRRAAGMTNLSRISIIFP